MLFACLALVCALVALKDVAAFWGLAHQIRYGGELAPRMESREATQDDFDLFVANSNPVDRFLYAARNRRLARVLSRGFRSWVTVSAGCVAALLGAGATSRFLVLAVGIATAINAMLHLITAVVRRLIFGQHDSHARDIQIATLTPTWAVSREPLANLSLYFLVLAYFAIVGFAALYQGIDYMDSHAFAHDHLAISGVTWIYLSITTIATVGFGDVHPMSLGAQVAVIGEIATGPLLLSWLISVFLTPRPD